MREPYTCLSNHSKRKLLMYYLKNYARSYEVILINVNSSNLIGFPKYDSYLLNTNAFKFFDSNSSMVKIVNII